MLLPDLWIGYVTFSPFSLPLAMTAGHVLL